MELTLMPVNDVLPDKITKLNCTLIPPRFQGDVRSVRLMQESLSKIINTLGEQSAKSQGLNKIITTATKLQKEPTHIVYLLKDEDAQGGKGEAIGLLKVGRKHLFLFDKQDKVCEVEPLCVLDFYIKKDRQRHGYGKILFDHMLQDNSAVIQELAIDGPSSNLEKFLQRKYGVEHLLLQNNNFAVLPDFFAAIPAMNKSGRSTPVITPAVGRFAAAQPRSSIANVIHGGGDQETRNGNASGAATPEPDAPQATQPEPIEVKPDDILELDTTDPPADETENKPEEMDANNPKSPERPSTLSVEPISETPAGEVSRRDSQLTDRGYFDVKFYHNKLW